MKEYARKREEERKKIIFSSKQTNSKYWMTREVVSAFMTAKKKNDVGVSKRKLISLYQTQLSTFFRLKKETKKKIKQQRKYIVTQKISDESNTSHFTRITLVGKMNSES